MTDTTVKPAPPAATRTRLMLEGPIVATLLRLAVPNLVVNVVLIAVPPDSTVCSPPFKIVVARAEPPLSKTKTLAPA